jgi:hypothetical protein
MCGREMSGGGGGKGISQKSVLLGFRSRSEGERVTVGKLEYSRQRLHASIISLFPPRLASFPLLYE